MSRDNKIEMYFDNESGKPFFEGGSKTKGSKRGSKSASMNKKSVKQADQGVPDDDQEKFIQKTFGLFSFQVLAQLVVVILCITDVSGEGDEKKDGAIRTLIKQTTTVAVSVVLALIATVVVVMKKGREEPLAASIGYPMYLLQTIGFAFVAGFIASRGSSAEKVLVVEIATMLIAVICVFAGGKILKSLKADKATSKLGPTFLVLSMVLATVLICAKVFNLGGTSNVAIMAVLLVLAVAFFIVDTKLIIEGKYSPMTKDDYIFASMKLYADFILVFGLLMELCQ